MITGVEWIVATTVGFTVGGRSSMAGGPDGS